MFYNTCPTHVMGKCQFMHMHLFRGQLGNFYLFILLGRYCIDRPTKEDREMKPPLTETFKHV